MSSEVNQMKELVRKLLMLRRDEKGAETVEWVIVVAVLVVAIIGGLSVLGNSANNALGKISVKVEAQGNKLDNPPPQ
jgi:Flp pilus assembly pilin Flp